ncbi:MAG: lysostaphin resistance A-like protein [Thainema sp.]
MLSWLGLWLPIAIAIAGRVKWQPFQPATPQQKLPLLTSLYIIAPFLLWGFIAVENSSFQQNGLSWTMQFFVSFGQGLGFGVIGIAALVGLQVGLGWRAQRTSISLLTENSTERLAQGSTESDLENQSEFHDQFEAQSYDQSEGSNVASLASTTPHPQLRTIIIPLFLLASWIGFTEELIFRGFMQTHLQSQFAVGWAAAIASVIFAISHVLWEGRQQVPQLPGLWLMGMVLVAARWVDGGSIGLAWGLHSGWIWSLACLDTAQLYQLTGKGPAWLTGTLEQPLFGLMPLVLLLGTGISLGAIFGL